MNVEASFSTVLLLGITRVLAQVGAPAEHFEPVRAKKQDCESVLDPAPDPKQCVCNLIRRIPVGAVFTLPRTKGVHVDWDRLKASIHYWKCFPKGATVPSSDYKEATKDYSDSDEQDVTHSSEKEDDYAADLDAVGKGGDYN